MVLLESSVLIKRGNREVSIQTKKMVKRKYLGGLIKHILVQDGDFVRAGNTSFR